MLAFVSVLVGINQHWHLQLAYQHPCAAILVACITGRVMVSRRLWQCMYMNVYVRHHTCSELLCICAGMFVV